MPRVDTIEDLAASYVEAIQTVPRASPFLLGGFSLGGVVAFEMACQLRAAGQGVALLAVIDASLPAARPTEPGEPDADHVQVAQREQGEGSDRADALGRMCVSASAA